MTRCLLTLALLAGALTACDRPKVDCDKLCARAKQCAPAVADAVVNRLPNKSKALQHARKELRKMVPALLSACPERCAKLSRSKRWRKALEPCQARPTTRPSPPASSPR